MEPPLQSATKVYPSEAINQPGIKNTHWTAEVALPISRLMERNPLAKKPANGVFSRVNFSRVQWQHEVVDGKYVRIPPHGTPLAESLNPEEQEHPENNWVWSPQHAVNMHLPQRWGEVEFC